MIEPTDEMVETVIELVSHNVGAMDGGAARDLVEAVLAIINRDYPATEYTLSALPEGDWNGSSFRIEVTYRGGGLWAVYRYGMCLSRSGEWDYESVPSERGDGWLAGHRFPLAEALRLARAELPKLRVNGMTAAEVTAWAEKRRNPL